MTSTNIPSKNTSIYALAGVATGLLIGVSVWVGYSFVKTKVSEVSGQFVASALYDKHSNASIENALSASFFNVELDLQPAPKGASQRLVAAIANEQDKVLSQAQECLDAVKEKNGYLILDNNIPSFDAAPVKSKVPQDTFKGIGPKGFTPAPPPDSTGYFKAGAGLLANEKDFFVMKTSYSYNCAGTLPVEGSSVLLFSKKADTVVEPGKLLNVIEYSPAESASDLAISNNANSKSVKERTIAEKLLLQSDSRSDEELTHEYPVLGVFTESISKNLGYKVLPVLSKEFLSALFVHNLSIKAQAEDDPCFAVLKEDLENLDDVEAPSLFYFNDARFVLTPHYIAVGFDNRSSSKACYAAMPLAQRKLKDFVNEDYARKMGLDFLLETRSVTNLEP